MNSKRAKVAFAVSLILLLAILVVLFLSKKPVSISPTPLEKETISKETVSSAGPVDDTFWKNLERRNSQTYRVQLKAAPAVLVVRPSHFAVSPTNNVGLHYGWLDGKLANLAVGFAELVSYAYSDQAVWDEHLTARTEFPQEWHNGHLTNTFDVIVTIPDHPKEKLQAEIKNLLRQQFGLAWHRETRTTETLLIRVKDLQLLNSRINADFPNSKSISELTGELENYFSKPVVDETGQTSRYDKSLEFVPARWVTGRTTDLGVNNEFLARYGLELAVTNQPTEWLALDQVARDR